MGFIVHVDVSRHVPCVILGHHKVGNYFDTKKCVFNDNINSFHH